MLALQKERRKEAKDVSLHDIDQETLREGGLGDGSGGFRHLESEQEAAATGLDGERAGGGKLLKFGEEVGAGVGDLSEETFIFDGLEELQAKATGERAAAEGAAVFCQAEGVEELFVDYEGAEGDAAAEGFAEDEGVGLNAGAGVGEPVARAAETALDLVEDEEGAVLVCDATGFDEECVVDDVNSTFTEDWLDKNGGGFVGDGGAKLVEVVAVDKGNVREAGAEVEAVFRLPGDGERTVRAAVVGVSQGNDAVLGVVEVLAGVGASELEGTFDGF